MESIIFTQLTVSEIREMLREEIQNVLKDQVSALQAKPLEKGAYMNIQELSEYINLAVATIYNLVSKGEIPYIKKGKKLRFEPKKIDKWLSEGRQKSNSEIRKAATQYMLKNRNR